jgi:3-oxoacyl-[acyl-carrier-protein] synthase III
LNAIGVGLRIMGCGSSAPISVLTNEDLSQLVDTSDEWIASRTGIKQRHIGANEGALTELAVKAASLALDMAKIAPLDVDLIILATSTPDDLFGTAGRIQHQLGATQAVAFDLTAACSGFVFGLVTASQFIATGTYKTVVVIGGDVLSRWVDWSDRGTCVLFGDGAGAVVCQASEENQLLSHAMYSDGSLHNCLNLGYQGQSNPLNNDIQVSKGTFHPITMNGREVYRFAVARVPEVIEKVLFQAKLATNDVDWLILHQANQRIMDAVASRLKIPSEKVISNLSEYGNTSAASIPLALDEAVRQGKIKTGDLIVTSGFGAGLSWGAAVFRWG